MNLTTFTSAFLSRNLNARSREFSKVRSLSSVVTQDKESSSDPKDVLDQQLLIESQSEGDPTEMIIEKKRNVSRLYPQHRNMVHDNVPWGEENPNVFEYANTVRYNRRMYGRYGDKSNVDPRIAWPTDSDLKYAKDVENLMCSSTIQEMVAIEKKKIQEEQEAIDKHQQSIVENLKKMSTWKAELKAKLLKNREAAEEAKRKKDRLMEEVRRHVGFSVSPADVRFQEVLEAKQKEQKKAQKLAKKKAHDDAMVQKMLAMAEEDKKGRKAGKKEEPKEE